MPLDIDGTEIRRRRKALGLSMHEASFRAGISASTWSRIERGKVKSHKQTKRNVLVFLSRQERKKRREYYGKQDR